MSQTCYCKVHCDRICMEQHQDSRTTGLKKTDSNEPLTGFSWLYPDANLSCWQKFHLRYGPRELFSYPKQIIEKYAECDTLKCHPRYVWQRKMSLGGNSLVEGPPRNDHMKQTVMCKPQVAMTMNSMIRKNVVCKPQVAMMMNIMFISSY
jgi:hypothetical protein